MAGRDLRGDAREGGLVGGTEIRIKRKRVERDGRVGERGRKRRRNGWGGEGNLQDKETVARNLTLEDKLSSATCRSSCCFQDAGVLARLRAERGLPSATVKG